MEEINGVYINKCHRVSGPCLFADQQMVPKEAYWDYYDSTLRAFVYLDCRIHQKYAVPSLLQIEDADKFASGIATASYETPDLQLADYNGRWMTRSDDPESYPHRPWDEAKHCGICDMVCDIRDDKRYLNSDGTCPYPDNAPGPLYWRVGEQTVKPCGDYLSPVMLLNLDAVNRKRRRKAKAFLWGYLKEKKWLDAHIQSERRMIDVWEKHYQPLQFYLPSMETLWLFVQLNRSHKGLVAHLIGNVEKHCANFDDLLEDEWQRQCWEKSKGVGR